MSDELDVSGQWSGVYSYAGAFHFVSFEAHLDEALGVIAGTTEETIGRARSLVIKASLQGQRESIQVSFVKRYDAPLAPGYGTPVNYEGTLNADGSEIHGEWTLLGGRGAFLMIRRRSLEAERAWLEGVALGAKR